ncbi:unnamed protein product, partial [Polarella glacialis]
YEKVLEGYGHVGVNLLTSAKLIVQEFSKYTNTLMFVVANELPVNDKNGFAAYPCVKSLTRDIHRYQASCAEGMRRVPLIYADVDMGAPDRGIIAKYMTCELESPDDAVDAYGLNVYSWCDENYLDEHKRVNFRYSPYQAVLDDFGGYDKPLLFTEFGCNTGVFETACPYPKGRTWPDVPHMFKETWSCLGLLVYLLSCEFLCQRCSRKLGFAEGCFLLFDCGLVLLLFLKVLSVMSLLFGVVVVVVVCGCFVEKIPSAIARKWRRS